MNKNSLLFWYPKLDGLYIPTPRTHCLPVDAYEILGATCGEKALSPKFISKLHEAAAVIGYPLFLRTDLQSGKHGWKNTCYVPDESRLELSLFGVAEENEMGACAFGPQYEALVFREFLDLETSFKAFYGEMPVNKERRYFIKDGIVLCHHGYWPEDAIDGHTKEPNWKAKLAVLNAESEGEIRTLTAYARRVSDIFPGWWSVDFALAKDGTWYLIDMALGAESFHWKGCPNGRV